MKLVTGIEAIQSGKPFRYVYSVEDGTYSDWVQSNWSLPRFPVLTAACLLEQRWEIKPEPREFWVEIKSDGYPIDVSIDDHLPYHGKTIVIKVREVISE